jgi:hypothetical protein
LETNGPRMSNSVGKPPAVAIPDADREAARRIDRLVRVRALSENVGHPKARCALVMAKPFPGPTWSLAALLAAAPVSCPAREVVPAEALCRPAQTVVVKCTTDCCPGALGPNPSCTCTTCPDPLADADSSSRGDLAGRSSSCRRFVTGRWIASRVTPSTIAISARVILGTIRMTLRTSCSRCRTSAGDRID